MPIDSGSAPRPRSVNTGRSGLFDSYRPLPGVPDELTDAAGRMRPVWGDFIAHLSEQSPREIESRFARGDRYLADAGVFFRQYGDDSLASRDWPFSPIPVILQQSDWARIAAGLTQRADLLEAVVADLYGPNRLVAEGHLPGALIAQSPEWLRPMVGVVPRGGHFLHFCAFEIGRGPDGRWWVLSDLTDAPSGAGFALENRITSTTIFPDLYAASNVQRLSGFFAAFRETLTGTQGGRHAAILTPGPMTDTYFEQAYIARYLGLPLLEGGDLTVSDGTVHIRTVKGLVPVEALWRRVDSGWLDPLELRGDSKLGTAGLVSAVRGGAVKMVNALGVGVLETQALMAFLPKISRRLLGQTLTVPNVATWWCGGAAQRAHVVANAGAMMIGPAQGTRLPFEAGGPYAIGGALHHSPHPDVSAWIAAEGHTLAAKELVTLSTTPVYEDGALVPRPMTLRVFLARTATGWQVMPGGFARIGARAETSALSMHNGGTVADVWVVGDAPEQTPNAAPPPPSGRRSTPPAAPYARNQPGPLPSRAADNLYWLGRYLERSEGLMRLLRAWHVRHGEGADTPLLAALSAQLDGFDAEARMPVPAALLATLASAVRSAGQIRDRFSVDAYAALTDLDRSTRRLGGRMSPGTDAALGMSVLLRKISGLSGLTHENMYRSTGWQFLTIGRALERAAMMAQLLIAMADAGAPDGGLALAIEVGDSVMIHRQHHPLMTSRESVIDLLVLDDQNPRSIRFQLDAMLHRTATLTADVPHGEMTDFERKLRLLQTQFTVHSVETLTTRTLNVALAEIYGLSDTLNAAFLH